MRSGCVFSLVESVTVDAGKTEEVQKCFLDSTTLETLRITAMEYRALCEYIAPYSDAIMHGIASNEVDVLKEMRKIETECRAEADARRVEGGDWDHGFRSGCQVALQLALGYFNRSDSES